MINHDTNITPQVAEKYLLRELPSAERDAFEQHFFDCPDCAEQVRIGFQFQEDANAVFSQEPRRTPPKHRDWFAWLLAPAPMMAGLAIVALCGYQNTVQIPELQAHVSRLQMPQTVLSTVLTPPSRSPVPSITIPRQSQFFQLSLVVATVPPAEQYRFELRSSSGKSIAAIPIPKPDPEAKLTLLIPTAGLSTGYYDAVLGGVRGGIWSDADHYRFSFHRE